VLTGLSTPNLKPSLNAARSIVLRFPMLTAIGQGAISKAELRRFLELIFWTIYFTDHPVEWSEFNSSRALDLLGTSIGRSPTRLIVSSDTMWITSESGWNRSRRVSAHSL
jgi:hypothetical protein